MFDSEKLDLFSADGLIRTDDLNIVPGKITQLYSQAPCDFQRGRLGIESSYALGVDPQLSAVGYFAFSLFTVLKETRVVLDSQGVWWTVDSAIESRPDMPGMVYCRVLFRQWNLVPINVIYVEALSFKAGGKVAVTDSV